ncbi:hypothetical protein AB0J21_03700 [Streptomyces sp. NPDC049954]|uniref:hypothetical protein n=1 Tax=Streptomyces sp. NPDC049954 TaxID=3155779 RepID=UPI00341DC38F
MRRGASVQAEPLVDDHVPCDAADAGTPHLLRDPVDPGERVLRRERGAGEVVGVRVIEVGVVDRAVGTGPAAQGEITLGDKAEIAVSVLPRRSPTA